MSTDNKKRKLGEVDPHRLYWSQEGQRKAASYLLNGLDDRKGTRNAERS